MNPSDTGNGVDSGKPGKKGLSRMIAATGYSLRGIRACFANEEAFRLEIASTAVLVPLSFFIARTVEQWLWLVVPILLLLIVELLNSAIETVVDRIGYERNELSGRAKDMSSAAVLLSLLLCACCWGAVIWKNFFQAMLPMS